MGIFPGKLCIQSDAADSPFGEILLSSCNQGATNSTAPHRTQCREGKNSAAGIVMLIAWRRKCADHPTHFALKHRHKCAVALIGTDPLHSHLHLGLCCFVPEVAHELRERRRIVWLGDANRKIKESFVRQDDTRSEDRTKEGVCNYVEIESGALPLIPTKPSRSKCKMIS